MLGDEGGVLDERLEVALDEPPELEIHEELIHRRVADPLTDAERAPMHAVRERGRSERVDRAEAAVVVPVEVDLHRAAAHDLVADEREEVPHALRCGVPARVGHADPLRARRDRRVVQLLERFRVGARRVLGDEHHRQARFDERRDARLHALQHGVDLPVLREPADRRRADKCAALDRETRFGRRLDRGAHVVGMRADGDVGTQALELRGLFRQGNDRRACLRRRTGQADVGAVDPERVHEMEEAFLDVERRIPDRRALQAVAKRLVIELDRAVVGARGAPIAIPVVDQLVELGLHATYGALAARAIGRGRITRTHHATRSATSAAVCPSATSATTISLRARSAKGSRIEAI